MELLCYCLSAVLLVLTGAVISGGLALPALPRRPDRHDAPDPTGDALSRDLAALMAYGQEEDDHAV
ncbi:MAG: hypothetical protein Q4D31_00605 [Eubacteriales bacterium]|nr:hypothetical protein [Eubacteriales bacterium]